MKSLFLFFFCVVVLSGCSKKLSEQTIAIQPRKMKDKDLIFALDSLSKVKYRSLYTKLDVSYEDGAQNLSFKTSIKHIDDSVINAIVSYLRFPVVSCLLHKDSLTIVNRNDKCFVSSDLLYLKNQFGIDVEFRNLEELLYGRPLDFDLDQKYFVLDNAEFAVSTHRKRERKRLERKPKEDIVITYFLDPSLRHLKKELIVSISDSVQVEIDYISFQLVDEKQIPKKVQVTISAPNKSLKISLEFNKVEVDQQQEILFLIPESYEECN